MAMPLCSLVSRRGISVGDITEVELHQTRLVVDDLWRVYHPDIY